MIESITNIIASISTLEWVSVAFGLAYVILAARENIWCWPAAFIGTGTAVFLFWDASLLMESGLNVYYLAMAVYGWWQWRYGGGITQDSSTSSDAAKSNAAKAATLRIQSWRVKQHFSALLLIAVLTLVSGYFLSANTQAALPYLDSFTTWSAVLTTWMVARKILENWLYWIVINLASIYLYLERGLVLYAALFVVYVIVAIYGYRVWRSSLHNQSQTNSA